MRSEGATGRGRPRVDIDQAIDLIESEGAEIFDVEIRRGVEADAGSCAAIFNAWADATEWMPRVHPPEDVARHYREHVFATCRVLAAERDGAVAGFLAVDGEGFVAALFVAEAARGQGVGAALLDAAKALRPEGLTLWTFAANAGARRFYGRHGFVEAGRAAGENEEGLPDVMLTWRGAA
ncbi:MAG: GNAT family N-acetyltransferase [Rhodobacteraceae bacterium]|nr:GNAT family N-acetyltransferase [Paracoccaceae bacterium]